MSAAANIPDDESQQLLRTVEMFEAITQAQADDYQSLEILKEAYTKLKRKDQALATSMKLVDAYEKQGLPLKAILECEGLLQENQNLTDVRNRLTALESHAKLPTNDVTPPPSAPLTEHKAHATPQAPESQTATGKTFRQECEEGDHALAEVFIAEKLAQLPVLKPLLARLKIMRGTSDPQRKSPLSLLQLAVDEQLMKSEDALTAVINKSLLPYIPLANYDVDRDTATLLTLDMCWQFCLVPFDQVGRSVLVATANPFQPSVRRSVEETLQAKVFWYIAGPSEIASTLRRAHRMEASPKQEKATS